MKHFDSISHVRGKSRFIDDIVPPADLLHASVLTSPCAHGWITELKTDKAEKAPGVRRIITAGDIPGENQIGNIVMDEPLLADGKVTFMGEPVAVVLAKTRDEATKARDLIHLDIQELPAVTDPRFAHERGLLLAPPRTFSTGKTDRMWEECDVIVHGRAESGGQEHLYLETQISLALPQENGTILIHSSTQGPSYVQKFTSRVLGIPMNRIIVDVTRLGGAFGGKEDQATPWAVMSALGTHLTGRPVKLVLSRIEDMRWTGKRHPYSYDFTLGLREDGTILAWEVTYFQNGGAVSDLSTAILERTLLHSTGSYFIPNVTATGISCRTNLPSNTAFRGFGGPQAMFVMEAAIRLAASRMGLAPEHIQEKNLLRKGDSFPFGMKYEGDEMRRSWTRLDEKVSFEEIRRQVEEFNREDGFLKKGFSVMPVTFGISFTNTTLNQANALVNVYIDGSVGVSTGAVEMGQGVNSKIMQVVSRELGIGIDRIKMESTNTTRAANASPTAASSAADMNGNAAMNACREIRSSLLRMARWILGASNEDTLEIRKEMVWWNSKMSDLNWNSLVEEVYRHRIGLSAQAHYATPGIYFDRIREKGRPFAYHVAGCAVTVVTLDTLRGTFTVDSVDIVHDAGESVNTLIDTGQIEGGLLQGIGWLTMEQLKYDMETAALLTDSLATYKVPDIFAAPRRVGIEFLPCTSENAGIYNSKAVGEPPFMYGIGTFCALSDALSSCGVPVEDTLAAPLTCERLLMLLSGCGHEQS